MSNSVVDPRSNILSMTPSERLACDLIHNLIVVLPSIRLSAERLSNQLDRDLELTGSLSCIFEVAKYLDSCAADLNSVTSARKIGWSFNPRLIHLEDVVQSAVSCMYPQMKSRGIRFASAIEAKRPICADAMMVQQMIMNALHFILNEVSADKPILLSASIGDTIEISLTYRPLAHLRSSGSGSLGQKRSYDIAHSLSEAHGGGIQLETSASLLTLRLFITPYADRDKADEEPAKC